MSEQQEEGSNDTPGDSAESGASTSQSTGASTSKESGASASKSKDGSTASQSKDGGALVSKSKEGASASSSNDGSKASSKAQASSSKEGSTSKSKESASSSKESAGVKVKSKEGASATKSSEDSKESKESKSNDGSKSKDKSSENSKEGASTESKKSGQKSKEKPKSSEKPKSKEKASSKENSREKSKSASKSKSKEKPKSKEKKSESKDRSKSKDSKSSKKVKSTASTASKGSQKSKDIKMHKGKKVNLGGAKIGFVGAGKMTDAIVRGLLTVAKLDPKKMYVAGKTGKTLDSFKSRGLTVSKRSYDIFGQYDCDIVFLCIHGYVIRSCFKGGGSRAFAFTVNYIPNQKHPLYVLSLIGGVDLKDIQATLLDPENPDKYMLFMNRIMLNIGVGYGIGMGAIDVEPDSKKCSPVIRDLLSAITKLDYFPEPLMDAACAIGGNGLALCYYFIANLADGGFKMGLNKLMATKLAAKALQSAAQCLLESNKHPSELQDSVTSQGGSAIYGIHVLDKADVASGFQAAIEGSYRRLKELVNIEPCTEMEAKPFKF